jgi:acyl carrier protein
MKVEDFLNKICDALGKEPNTLTLDDTTETVEEWDSVGHLSIVAVMDEELGVAVDNEELLDFDSMQTLVDRLKVRGALED